jgi:glycosyltransferase involved in cell wall biosynthesis
MNSICLFCSYFNSPDIPNYVQYYIKELTRHFTKIIFVTNEKSLSDTSTSFLKTNRIEPFFVTNEGYDFGMWYKAMIKYDVEQYDRLGLVNDSCILFKPLDDYFNWLNKQFIDYAGINDSQEIIYHIQSFFLTINKNAITPTLNYFKNEGLQVGRQEVIKIYELGLCKHLQELGLKTQAWFPYKKFIQREENPTLYAVHQMIKEGYPLIKRKIIFNSFSQKEYQVILTQSFRHNPNYYINLIRKVNNDNELFNFNLLQADGYKPNLKKTYALEALSIYYRTLSIYHRIKKMVLLPLKFIYHKLKIRELLNKMNDDPAASREESNLKEIKNTLIPVVSVCIPTYNGSKYLEACLQSVYQQTYIDFEIIICDDCSTDNTLEIAKAFQEKDTRIKLFVNENNLGLVGNWNHCIELADGEWIKFVFQDDLMSKTCLQEMIQVTNNNTQMVVCEREFLFENGINAEIRRIYNATPRMYQLVGNNEITYISSKHLSSLIAKNFPSNFIGEPTSTMFRKSVIEKIGFFNPKIAQLCDLEYCLRMGVIDGFIYISNKLINFRVHGSSTTQKNNSEKYFTSFYSDRIIILCLLLFDLSYKDFRKKCARLELYKLKHNLFYTLHQADLYIKIKNKDKLLLNEFQSIKDMYPKIKQLHTQYLFYVFMHVSFEAYRKIGFFIKGKSQRLIGKVKSKTKGLLVKLKLYNVLKN